MFKFTNVRLEPSLCNITHIMHANMIQMRQQREQIK